MHNVKPTDEVTLRERFKLGNKQIVYSALAMKPHKNVLRLVEAIGRTTTQVKPILVMSGYRTSYEQEIRDRAGELGLAENIRLCGWLSNENFEGFYRMARCSVFPSLYEGFGLPVLEAMARDLPVACSNSSSLPEVAGDAAIYFDPYDVDAIAHALTELLTDAEKREELITLGREQVKKFTWERAAAETMDTYIKAIRE